MAKNFNVNSKTITAPLAALCMAAILFVYSRTSILAAKRNAQKHREADGGQLNWHNENLRRHGKLARPVQEGTLGQLAATLQDRHEDTNSKAKNTPAQTKRDPGERSAAEKELRDLIEADARGK
ncbi:hypothetical protein GcC1_039007 [Golovinomyces cichoracearum]|uniref:Uncharacterized protein n=1 Tax=Golovinomyces cichoracearum TaxID=62708 RepID=A0A420IZY3_9PEZI|nr:hypothetical protein GcC1_039007 [Golovinomyces cichoracearum]